MASEVSNESVTANEGLRGIISKASTLVDGQLVANEKGSAHSITSPFTLRSCVINRSKCLHETRGKAIERTAPGAT